MISDRYVGERGVSYYQDVQRESGLRGGQLAVAKFLPYVSAEDRVVDVGCGGAFLLERLPGRVRIGVEPNATPRNEAIERGLDVRADLSEIDDAEVDVVISHHALEHSTDPFGILREIRRVLVPGGRLVVFVPLDDWRRFRTVRTDEQHGHLFAWPPQHLYNMLEEVGFLDIDVTLHTSAWPPKADRLARFPKVFEAACYATSLLLKRRELSAVATTPV